MSHNTRNRLKCVLLGKSGVGKTSIAKRYIYDTFSYSTDSTIGASFFVKNISTGDFNNEIRLEIWDTAGQERYEALVPMYYKGADIVLVVYDICDSISFNRAKKWIEEIQYVCEPIPVIVLIGNKCDMIDNDIYVRAVSTTEAEVLASTTQHNLFYETSAKLNKNVNTIFNTALSKINANHETDANRIILFQTEENQSYCCYK